MQTNTTPALYKPDLLSIYISAATRSCLYVFETALRLKNTYSISPTLRLYLGYCAVVSRLSGLIVKATAEENEQAFQTFDLKLNILSGFFPISHQSP